MLTQKIQKIRKARAVVIKERHVGESNKQLTLLAKDTGKLLVSARGAKNHRSKFLAGAQPFCYCDFVLFDGGDFLAVNQIDLIRNFSVYYDDVLKLMYGAYFLELIDKTVMFSQEANDVMRLLIKSLHLLEKEPDAERISVAFQIKLFDLLGFCPHAVCSLCGGGHTELYYTDAGLLSGNGFVCRNCAGKADVQKKATPSLIKAISYITASSSPSEVFSFSISKGALLELRRFAELIVKSQIETEFNSMEIIKRL